MDQRDFDRLRAEALAPLTPAEREEQAHNTRDAQWWGKLVDLYHEVERARRDFCKDALLQQVEKGDVPDWVMCPERGDEARGWLKEHGYHWQIDAANPLWMALCKGDRRVAELKIKLTGDEASASE